MSLTAEQNSKLLGWNVVENMFSKSVYQSSQKKFKSVGLRLFLFILPWQTVFIYRTTMVNGAKWEYGTLAVYALEIILLFLLVIDYKSLKIFWKSIPTAWRWLFGLMILAASQAIDPLLAAQMILHFFEALGFFFLLKNNIVSKQEVAWWLLAGSILPSSLGIYQFLSQTTIASSWFGLTLHHAAESGTSVIVSDSIGRWLRAYGPFSHPNVFGGYLAIVLIISLACVSEITSSVKVWLGRISIFLATIALIMTLSRTAWLAFAFGLVTVFFPAWKKNNDRILINGFAISLIISIFLYLLAPLVFTRTIPISSHEVQSISERVSGYQTGFTIIKQHPWLGVGAGNYTAYLKYLDPTQPGWYYQPAHNIFLLFVAEFGLAGVILFFIGLKNIWSKISRVDFTYLGIFLILGSFDHYLYTSYSGLIMCSILFYYFSTPYPPPVHNE